MPDPRSIVGRLLSRKKKPIDPAEQELRKKLAGAKERLDSAAKVIKSVHVPEVKSRLEKSLATLRKTLSTVSDLKDLDEKGREFSTLDSAIGVLLADKGFTTSDNRKSWAVDRLAAIRVRLKKVPKELREQVAGKVDAAQQKIDAADLKYKAGDYDGAASLYGGAYFDCQDVNTVLDSAAYLAQIVEAHRKALLERDRMAKHKEFDPRFKAMHARLGTVINEAALVIQNSSTTSKDDLFEMSLKMLGAQRSAKNSLDEYDAYLKARKSIDELVQGLTTHKQTLVIAAEIRRIRSELVDLEKLGEEEQGGWHRAKMGLPHVKELCVQARSLAQAVESAKAKTPELLQGLKSKNVPTPNQARLLSMSLKLLAQEKCSVDEAVGMALAAARFVDEGQMDETDGLTSARLVRDMRKDDPGITEEHAFQIGRQMRSRGSATMEDMACVAKSVKRMPAKVLEALNDNGVVTGVCRGPVTDMLPELSDVNPRGWGSRTWDEVPGVYMGDKQMVVVGTMNDKGQRKIPGKSEGPIKHGTNDLLGHESGHAFDVTGGGSKRNDPGFVSARNLDVAETGDDRIMAGRDDYFMTRTESASGNQADDDAARSETFAESFAMFFDNSMGKWPNLKDFWANNPWT